MIKTKNIMRLPLIICFWVYGNSFFTFAVPPVSTPHVADTVILGMEPNYPPFCILNEKGNPDGFSVELFKAVAKAAGFEVITKIGTWNIIRNELKSGVISALPIVGQIPERESDYNFSMPYITLHNDVFVRGESKGVTSLNDLKNKEILAMSGDNGEMFLRRENITEHIYTTSTFEEAFIELASGQHDAILMQRLTGVKLLEKMKIDGIEPLNINSPLLRVDYCFAVKEGNSALLSKLNEGLAVVIANNTYKEIYEKWFGPVLKEKLSVNDFLKVGVLIFVPLAVIMSLLLIFFLRKEVARRTRDLKNEIAEHKKTLETVRSQQLKIAESESEIRLLLDSTAEGIFSINKSGSCTLINKSALQMLGYNSESEVIGRNMHELIHHSLTDGSPCLQKDCSIYLTFLDGKSAHVQNEVFWRSDNTAFLVEYYSHPVVAKGDSIGVVVTFWDITNRKKTEEELQKLNNELENLVNSRTAELEEKIQKLNRNQKAMLYMIEDLNLITSELKTEREKLEMVNKELDAFSYSVSHDLRSPLRAIDGFSGFLLEDHFDKLDDEGKRLLTVIRENTLKMDELITSILNLSRVTRTTLRFSKVDMQATAWSMYLEIATTGQKSEFEINIGKLPKAICDFALIKQVWQNLIGNALKYSSKSERKKIEIGCFEEDQMLTYFVRDYGVGFDSNYKDNLFNPFQRLHKNKDFEGTGVGLAVVQRIISRHNGTVKAESELNNGATFYFSLPKINQKSKL